MERRLCLAFLFLAIFYGEYVLFVVSCTDLQATIVKK